jgi:hypothetical protein
MNTIFAQLRIIIINLLSVSPWWLTPACVADVQCLSEAGKLCSADATNAFNWVAARWQDLRSSIFNFLPHSVS